MERAGFAVQTPSGSLSVARSRCNADHERNRPGSTCIEDPQYLEEPFIQSVTYQWEPHTELEYFPCTIVNENISNKIPHFLPGKNPWLREFSEQEGLPYEATRGGAETMYPEYRAKMKNMKVAPLKPTPRAF